MTEYHFMPAYKVADLDAAMVSLEDCIFGDLQFETLTEEILEQLNK